MTLKRLSIVSPLFSVLIACLVSGGALSGCSSRTQQNAKETTHSAGEDMENAAEETGEAAEEGADETGEAVEGAGDKVEEKTDEGDDPGKD